MRFIYECEKCHSKFADFRAEYDAKKFGFDCLTLQESEAIIKFDSVNSIVYVQSLCDDCTAITDRQAVGYQKFVN